MKFGAFASFFAPSTPMAQVGALAQQLESHNLESLWFGEHVLLFDEMEFGYPGSADGKLPVPPGEGAPDQGAIIGYLSALTTSLRFGTGISLIPQRNPIYTAKEFATLDWMSNGRVELGIGVGWCKEEVEACGYEWDNRGRRCDEALDLMQKLWTEEVTHHNGEFFEVKGARMDPKPVQSPHVPLIVGGFSDAAMARTAKYGAGWLGFGTPPQITAVLLDKLDTALAAAGKSRSDIEILMMPGDESDEALDAYAELGIDRMLPMIAVGDDDAVEARVQQISGWQTRYAD